MKQPYLSEGKIIVLTIILILEDLLALHLAELRLVLLLFQTISHSDFYLIHSGNGAWILEP